MIITWGVKWGYHHFWVSTHIFITVHINWKLRKNPMDFSTENLRSKLEGRMPCHEFEKKYTHGPPIDGHPGCFFQRDFRFLLFFLRVFCWKKKGGCLGWALFCVTCYIIKDQTMYVLGCNTKVPKTFNFNVVRLIDKNHAPRGCIHETSWNMRQFCIQSRWRIFVHCNGWWWPTILMSQRPMLIVPTKIIQRPYAKHTVIRKCGHSILHPYYLQYIIYSYVLVGFCFYLWHTVVVSSDTDIFILSVYILSSYSPRVLLD